MIKYTLQDTHIENIYLGDTILLNGKLTTVSKEAIKRGFTGRTLYGDSYNLGQKPVKKAVIYKAMPNIKEN